MQKHKVLNSVLSMIIFVTAWYYLAVLYAGTYQSVSASLQTQIFEQGKNVYQDVIDEQKWPDCSATNEYSDELKKLALKIDSVEGDSAIFSTERVESSLENQKEAFWKESLELEEGNVSSLLEGGSTDISSLDAGQESAACEQSQYEQKYLLASSISTGLLETGVNEIQEQVTHLYTMVEEKIVKKLSEQIRQGVAKMRKKFTEKGGE